MSYATLNKIVALQEKYATTQDPNCLNDAIHLTKSFIRCRPANDDKMVVWHSLLGDLPFRGPRQTGLARIRPPKTSMESSADAILLHDGYRPMTEFISHVEPLMDAANDSGNAGYGEEAIALTEEVIAACYASTVTVTVELNSILEQPFEPRDRHSDLVAAVLDALLAGGETIPGGEIQKHIRKLVSMFNSNVEIQYLNDSINFAERMIQTMADDDEQRAAMLNNIGWYRLQRFQHSGPDLQRPIEASGKSVAHLKPDDEILSPMRTAQRMEFLKRFERNDDDLENGIGVIEYALNDAPAAYQDIAVEWMIQGGLFTEAFQRFGKMEDLDKAIRILQKAFDGRTPTVYMWSVKATQHLLRFERLGRREDLDQGIEAGKNALAGMSPGEQDHLPILTAVASALAWRFFRYGVVEDLQMGIVLLKEAAIAPGPKVLTALALLYHTRFHRFGALEDLEMAVDNCTKAAAELPPDHADRTSTLDLVGRVLSARFEQFGDLEDLATAINAKEGALAVTPLEDADRAWRLDNLSYSLGIRYAVLGDQEDIKRAISASTLAVAATPTSHPARGGRLGVLSDLYGCRFTQQGAVEDLRSAIEASEQALRETPSDHPEHAHRLHSQSALLQIRFEQFGELHDLAAAIQLSEQAVAATPVDDLHRVARVGQLSTVFMQRYDRIGAMNDMLKSIEGSKETLAGTPLLHILRPGRLHEHSALLLARFDRLGSLEDLAESGSLMEQAAEATPAGHPSRAIWFSEVSKRFTTLFMLSDNEEVLHHAVELIKEAVMSAPVGHPQRPLILYNFSHVLAIRFFNYHEVSDLMSALGAIQEAVEATPVDHPNRGTFLLKMAFLYVLVDRSKSLATALDAWNCLTMPPRRRIKAARLAGCLLENEGRWVEAGSMVRDAIKLVPTISLRFLGRIDQQFLLATYAGLPGYAVAITLQAGSPAWNALSLLELVRGIIMGYSIDCRSDLSDLATQNPPLFSQFTALCAEINTPLVPSVSYMSTDEDKRRRRLRAIQLVDQTLATIRRIPGFQDFQRPASSETLLAMSADEGPIVILNSTVVRSDAIIVTLSGIKSLDLPGLLYADVVKWMEILPSLVRGKRSEYPSKNRELIRLLLWLWDTAVEPVLKDLGLGPVAKGARVPRIWWIGLGPLAAAPFHAAGDHSTLDSTRNTINRAISSYIPTLKALSFARERKLELLRNPLSRLLIVTMPTTPDTPAQPESFGSPATRIRRWGPLRSATLEADGIMAAVVDNSRTVTCLNSPTASHVLESLPEYNAIHFACHGVSDLKNPSNSHLVLHGDPARITVEDIANMNIRNAQIAYLSACSSAENSSPNLSDESIYIASGFQLAGFSHVLGMLWPVDDLGCSTVAVEFYKRLFKCGPDESGDGHAAVSAAHHEAVKMWRGKYLSQPIKWAAFIHTGA